jgi:demethylmenaquinone methyltransferase/2-methoxy-6-polyprenyl-1,4-benzoquinol methylase
MSKKKPVSRVTRTKEQARASYDKMSRWYDRLAGFYEKKYREAGLAMLTVREGERVLEVGFGTGPSLPVLAEAAGKEGRVYGIDISDGMLKAAVTRLKKEGLDERVELIRGDAAVLPYGDAFFDAVFICFTLELFDTPEIPEVLHECRRAMKSGGRICIVALSKEGRDRLMITLYEWAHRKFPASVDCRPIYLRSAMEEAGFKTLKAEDFIMWGLPVEIVVARKE